MRLAWYIPILSAAGVLAFSSCRDADIADTRATPEPVAPTFVSETGELQSDAAAPPAGMTPEDVALCELPASRGMKTRPLVRRHRFEHPVLVTQPPGEHDTLFVVERVGRILLVADGRILRKPFLDISSYLDTSHPERGLIGVAFHPGYQTNGRFYLNYTPGGQSRNVVAEWTRRFGDPVERRRLVELDDSAPDNNGGGLAFGPDGLLYVGVGDEGGKSDPHGTFGHAQDNSTLFGSILRLNVDDDARLAARENPFVDRIGEDLIWAMGVRNPWRFSFDRETGALFVGDRGQSKYEEITIIPATHASPLNLGWRAFEGFSVHDDDLTEMFDHHHAPSVVYPHRSDLDVIRRGCAIVGGHVYRGESRPELRGAYLYGDRCSDDVAAFNVCDETIVGPERLPELSGHGVGLTSFGEDNAGELYMTFDDGQVLRIVMD